MWASFFEVSNSMVNKIRDIGDYGPPGWLTRLYKTAESIVAYGYFSSIGVISLSSILFTIAGILIFAASIHVSALLFALFVIDLLLAVISVGIWMLGRKARHRLHHHWESQVYGFNQELEDGKIENFYTSICHAIYYPLSVPEYELPEFNRNTVVYNMISQLFWGMFILMIGILAIVGFEEFIQQAMHDGEPSIDGTVSLIAGFISVMLSPVLGAIVLGLVSFSTTPEELILFFFGIILPMLYLVPGARNLIAVSTECHYNLAQGAPSDTSYRRYLALSIFTGYYAGILLLVGFWTYDVLIGY